MFDEWQETPELWNLVRRAVDDHAGKGLYVLTGSSRSRDDTKMHSDAGRIARLRMRPMSLFETGHSTGEVSLRRLLEGEEPAGTSAGLAVEDLLERIVIGGWPDLLDAGEHEASLWLRDYLRTVAEVDVPGLGPRRNPGNIERLLTTLGRGAGTPLNLSSVAEDVGGARGVLPPRP
ncbi:AAA family ATPase [Tessaracoccus timonensis]|uniref:AAA family ATPase n=1 Tax=Tessaracoccus timonensis TaxID=2161816 RepID=UPI001E3CCD5D|nr:AAA family ATPase [Tessaracoccus timonensis]